MQNLSDGRQVEAPVSRVSKACHRCRKTKTKCDREWPCVPCIRARADCIPASSSIRPRAAKRARHAAGDHGNQHDDVTSAAVAQDGPSTAHRSADQLPTQHTPQPQNPQERNAPSPSHSAGLGETESAMGMTRKIFQFSKEKPPERTSAVPDGTAFGNGFDASNIGRTRSTADILGCDLPDTAILLELLQEYFDRVHWFSLVIYEPIFRPQFESVRTGTAFVSQRNFLFLLATVAGLAAWYKSQVCQDKDAQDRNASKWGDWASKLLKHVEKNLWDLMEHTSLLSVQTSILLASYLSYHGKPNTSFALLGATIKQAQTLGLHREPSGDVTTQEQRKRIWWTIYTWDRFASITFGRPLGINDDDCNVSMPIDITEHYSFSQPFDRDTGPTLCYSSYQRELNKLYHIASPVIEVVCGLRTSAVRPYSGDYLSVVSKTSTQLDQWRQNLPGHLNIDLSEDLGPSPPTYRRIFLQQALALQQTMNYLIVVLYRPFLALEVEKLSQESPTSTTSMAQLNAQSDSLAASATAAHESTGSMHPPATVFTDAWWNAAIQTSRITRLPQLAQTASEGHLVAFMAISLFNAAVVLAVLALSDPLSQRAQEAKRHITRIYRLQEALGKYSALSSQSGLILQGVIRILLKREEGIMLSTLIEEDGQRQPTLSQPLARSASNFPSIQDALAIPLDYGSQTTQGPSINSAQSLSYDSNHADASRLHESLASVQQVFQPGEMGEIQQTVPHDGHVRRFGAQLHRQRDNDLFFDALTPGEEELWNQPDFSNGQNDMFWIWNVDT